MKQVIVKPKDLEKYMGKEKYKKFIKEFKERHNLADVFCMIAEGYDKNDKRK